MGMPQTKRDSKLTILSQTFDNKRDFRKSVPSSIVTITGSMNRTGFNERGTGTGKATFDIATNYQGNSWIYVYSESYHIGLSLDDGKYYSKYCETKNGSVLSGPFNFDDSLCYPVSTYGTPVFAWVNNFNYLFKLSDFRNAGHLKFFLWECSYHLNTWYGSDVYINFGNHYYYKYHVAKTSSVTEWRLVEKGKYYQGLY